MCRRKGKQGTSRDQTRRKLVRQIQTDLKKTKR
jgi:hypothetical protein